MKIDEGGLKPIDYGIPLVMNWIWSDRSDILAVYPAY